MDKNKTQRNFKVKKIILSLLLFFILAGSAFAQCYKPVKDSYGRSTGIIFYEKMDAIVTAITYREYGDSALAEKFLKLKKIKAVDLIPNGEKVKILKRENGLVKLTPCEKGYKDVVVWGFESSFIPVD